MTRRCSGTALQKSIRLLEERQGFSRPELRSLILNAISASWLPAERKTELMADFCDDPVWLEN